MYVYIMAAVKNNIVIKFAVNIHESMTPIHTFQYILDKLQSIFAK